MLKLIYRVFFTLALASLLLACAPPREPVNLAGSQWLGYQPLYLAGAPGCAQCPFVDEYYGERAYQLTMMPSTTVVARLMANGQLDGALLTLDEALSLQSRSNLDVCVARVLSFSAGADAMLMAENVNLSKKPLVIGYEETALGGYFLQRAMDSLLLTRDDIEIRMLLPSEHADALRSGSVDMVITYQPFISQLEALGAQVGFDSSEIPYGIVDVLLVRSEVWRREQHMLEWLVGDLWESGLRSLFDRESATEAMLLNNTGLDSVELTAALTGLHFLDYQESRQILRAELTTIIRKLNTYMHGNGLIEQPATLPSCYELTGE
ncbi:nitrate ABC transporter [Aliidiomarina sp.]|uniref:nitrate ABC transporter n=1 Tax=Aliidiomarina sp. TaxID=1872439 RepID=UPI003A4E422D